MRQKSDISNDIFLFIAISFIAIQISILFGLGVSAVPVLLNLILWGIIVLRVLPLDMTRYKIGDKVVLVSHGACCWEADDWVSIAGLTVGETYTVKEVSFNSLTVEGGKGYHLDKCHFRRVTQRSTG